MGAGTLRAKPAPGGGGQRHDQHAVFWSPADWAWTGGLMDALLPTLYFGRPIVGYNGRFSPELAFTLMQEHGVTHTFLFPTALKAMMKAYPEPRQQFRLQLQAIMSAGEAVGDAVFAYCRDHLGVIVNEMFGQTEINYVVGNCSMEWAAAAAASPCAAPGIGWPARPGSMGRPYPGHRVAVIDDDGNECPVGVPGDVAVNRYDVHGDPDPIFFLGYWKNEAATRAKFTGDWCRTGDLATRDADGYLWYQGRADDVFKAAGYRIGPSEIENCLVKHPAVINAAVVPKPDRERGALVKAFVVLSPEFAADARAIGGGRGRFRRPLVAQLQAHVQGQARALRVPEGDRVHRRAADDDHRQGAAARAALAGRGEGAGRSRFLNCLLRAVARRPRAVRSLVQRQHRTAVTPCKKSDSAKATCSVTPICLGTMTFGEQVDEPTAHAILDRSLARGIDFIDTAEMYAVPARAETFGATETIIGNWFAKHPGARNKLVLATKVAGPSRGMPWVRAGTGLTAQDIVASCEGSLKRLKTDVIDLYQIHWPERNVPVFGQMYYDPTQGALHDLDPRAAGSAGRLVQQGKVRYIGLSNETPYGVHEFVRLAEQHGLPRIATRAERLLPAQPRRWKTAWTKPCTGSACRCWRIRRWGSAC